MTRKTLDDILEEKYETEPSDAIAIELTTGGILGAAMGYTLAYGITAISCYVKPETLIDWTELPTQANHFSLNMAFLGSLAYTGVMMTQKFMLPYIKNKIK
jgi:hypothetical protein